MTPLTYAISAQISRRREERGWNQRRLANASGVGVKTISSYETGNRVDSIKVVQLEAIANAFDLTLSEFLQHCEDAVRQSTIVQRATA